MRLFRHHLARTWKLGLLVSMGLFGFQLLIVRIFSAISGTEGAPAPFTRFMPQGLRQFLGIDQLPMDTINGFLAVAYQHPFLLIALLAIPISTITALLAGEIERKTIALLLSRPISRIGIVVSAAATSALWSALAITASTAGTVIAANLAGQAEKLNMAAIQSIGANLFALGLAVAGICLFFSACTNERSDATGWTVTVILFMYVWNFLSQMWPVARPYGGISVFHFFSPAQVMLGTANLSVNHAVLGVVACVGLIMGCLVYSTREFRI